VLLSWVYFRRCRLPRPPLGVFDLADVLILMVAVVVVPVVYLALPVWLVGLVLGGLTVGILFAILEPLLRSRRATWLGVLALAAADLAAWLQVGSGGGVFLLVNDLVLLVAAVGVANLWAQGGLKARNAAVLGGLLAVYDGVATARLPLMDDLLARLGGLPFAPQMVWPSGDGQVVGLGLGDLLLACAFPLVLRKAFGRQAGLAAMAASLLVVGALLGLGALGVLGASFPLMVALGPAMVLQYALWVRRRPERTTAEYLRAEPLPRT
jgi:hypothetical protein